MAGSAIERLSELEASIKELSGGVVSASRSAELAAQRVIALEHSLASLGKTLTAVIKELQAKSLVSDTSIMGRIRDAEDEQQKEQVEMLISSGTIAPVSEVNELSLVVISQEAIELATGAKTKISGFRTVEMPNPGTPDHVKKELLGLKSGDQFQIPSGDTHAMIITVLATYNLVEVASEGEVAPEAGKAEETAEKSSEGAETASSAE